MTNRRAYKKMENRYYGPMYDAWILGQCAAQSPKTLPPRLRVNPYPPGRRHDEWNHSYNLPTEKHH